MPPSSTTSCALNGIKTAMLSVSNVLIIFSLFVPIGKTLDSPSSCLLAKNNISNSHIYFLAIAISASVSLSSSSRLSAK